MTTVDHPVVPRNFPPLTVKHLRSKRCAGGHHLPKDPAYLIRRDGQVFCPTCPTSHRRAPNSMTCVNGHDITAPGSLLKDNRCAECRRERNREYKRVMRARAREERKRAAAAPKTPVAPKPSYFGHAVPPIEVRMNARCGPETAYLFDLVHQPGESKKRAATRHMVAARLCAACPVFAGCEQWYSNEPSDTATVAALR